MKALAVLFTVLCLSFAFASPSVEVNQEPLQIVIATESLCPDCQDFITTSYATAIKTPGIEQIANITIVPFGNAKETPNGDHWDFTCQHGANECLGNALENCLFAHNDKATAERVLVCFENMIFQSGATWTKVVDACGKQENVDLSDLLDCATSDEGNTLTHQAAQNTDPTHLYVPWVTVNGVHDSKAEQAILDDLVKYACKHFKGTDTIPACKSLFAADQPLQIVVATESLCPDCQDFITNSYAKAIRASGIEKIVNITVIPFGNARESPNGDQWTFTCQHGAKECLGNAIENCLFAHYDKAFAQQALVCFEDEIFQQGNSWEFVVAGCGNKLQVDLSSLLDCANGDEGNTLTHQAAQNTDPTHEYVPWILVNGVHDTDAEDAILDDLLGYACRNYNGSEKIPACQQYYLRDQSIEITVMTESLCPYCQQFITTTFADALQTQDFDKIAKITIIPFGNARETPNGEHWNFTCQHGAQECLGNAVENCLYNQTEKAVADKVLVCLENKIFQSGSTWTDVVSACATEEGADLSNLMSCATGPQGEALTHQAALNTDPNHQYVPWVVVNGIHDETDEDAVLDNVVKYVCENYKGPIKIAACQDEELMSRSYNKNF